MIMIRWFRQKADAKIPSKKPDKLSRSYETCGREDPTALQLPDNEQREQPPPLPQPPSTNESGEPAALDVSSLCTIPPGNSSFTGISSDNVSLNEIADNALKKASASVTDHVEMEEV